MNKRIIYLLAIVSIFLITSLSCKKNPVKPPEKETECIYPEGNRNFTWRMDTVALFPSTLGGVWAFSDSDAYLMGNIFQWTNGVFTGYVGLHWDGSSWNTDINGTVEEIKHVANDVTGDDHYLVSVGNWSINPPKPALGEFDNRTKKWKGYQFQTQGELRSVWTDGKGYFIAVGDNGMVYTKDGYSADWVYSKAPTDFNFYRVSGVSKNEIYILGRFNTIENTTYSQIWKYENDGWIKLLDDCDIAGSYIKIPNNENTVSDIYANRCSITDSLQLYIIGWESYLFKSKGNTLNFEGINLTSIGLLLRNMGRTGLDINGFSPSDLWIFGTRYNFFHWNGMNFQKIIFPGFPNNDTQFGDQRKMIKTKSGKVFLPSEVSSQVYVILQGTSY